MSNGNAWERHAKLTAAIGKMLLDGTRWVEDLNEIHQDFVSSGRWSKRRWEAIPKLVVDCDTLPYIPSGLNLEGKGAEHRKLGKITLEKRADGKLYANGREVICYLTLNQEDGKRIEGDKLRKELQETQILNGCILDALFAHPELIPDEWKHQRTYFWATVFSIKSIEFGNICVGYLCWEDSGWHTGRTWLRGVWFDIESKAALVA